MKKLVFFTLLRTRSWGGSENLWFRTACLALQNGQEVLVITEQDDHENYGLLRALGADIFILETFLVKKLERLKQLLDNSFAKGKFLTLLEKRVRLFNPDLIIVNQPGCFDLLFNETISKFIANTEFKYIVCSHSYIQKNVLNNIQVKVMANLLKEASKCFFVAQKQAHTILKQLKINLTNIEYLYNPLNLKSTDYIPYPKTETIYFAMVGSLDIDWKGQDIVINILSKLEWMKRNWYLNIFGDGPDLIMLKELIEKHNLQDKIKLKGQNKDIRKIWEHHHILLMPSRVDAAPSVLLEAMACGRTAICTNIGFVEDWIEDNINGFIAQNNNIDVFAEMLNDAWHKKASWENMGFLAHEKVTDYFPEKPEQFFLDRLNNE
ncbi:glycosyltransferase [Pedobacter chinensis]|uniref:Glycosyltransferase n=1 Tax=Pedobacter chinensis TaxID=2282421 RepID=A0A369PVC3_9SPHI|nr:glycosyltransferase [Pedobacter chinensis]RDC56222.1 glycosyltransferase [Pedobacter chinensis]